MSAETCPKCSQSKELHLLTPDQKVLLSVERACAECLSSVGGVKVAKSKSAQDGKVLTDRARHAQDYKEQQRLLAWRNRGILVKEARDRFHKKDFPRAISGYENYLKVLHAIWDVDMDKLDLKYFNNPARIKELTVIASVYWDMVRIYDQMPKYRARLSLLCQKLAVYMPKVATSGEVLRQIDEYRRKAKNRDIFDRLYRESLKNMSASGLCFVATATLGSEAPELETFYFYRDQVLAKYWLGQGFTKAYYYWGPWAAYCIDAVPPLKVPARAVLQVLADAIDRKYHLKDSHN